MSRSMISRRVRRNVRRQGFTLLELTIVLLILVAIAGIMIPLFSNYVDKAHNAAGSANVESITKQVQQFQADNLYGGGYPDQLDDLTQAKLAIHPNAQGEMTNAALGAGEAAELAAAGVNSVESYSDLAANNQTFTVAGTPTKLTDTSTVMHLATNAAGTAFLPTTFDDGSTQTCTAVPNPDLANYDYVLFGLGNKSTIVGKGMTEAPVHFDSLDPSLVYQRYGLIFAVPKSTGTAAGSPAKLAAVCGMCDEGISGLDIHIQNYMADNK